MRPACLITVTNSSSTARHREPVTVGVPLPRGWCDDPQSLTLRDQRSALPLQVQPLERWSDGSLRWVLLDFQPSLAPASAIDLGLEPAPAERSALLPLDMRAGNLEVTVESGDLVAVVGGKQQMLLRLTHDGRVVDGTLQIRQAGQLLPTFVERVEVEVRGPLRAAAQIHGNAGEGLRWTLRVEAFAGTPGLRLQLTLHNPRRAAHPGNFWELGDAASLLLQEVTVRFEPPNVGFTSARCSLDASSAPETLTMPLALRQESSGGEHWQSPVHVTRDGTLPFGHRGYRLTTADEERTGLRASPLLHARSGDLQVSLAAERFWEVFPKALHLRENALELGILPPSDSPHELQGGERLSYRFTIGCGHDPVSEPPLAWARTPLAVTVPPEWAAVSGAVPYLSLRRDTSEPYEHLVDSAIEGDHAFAAKRERIDEYGWRHFGDLYADHENGSDAEHVQRVSHYNNQYDALAGLLIQHWRSGDPRWRALADALATHVAHIDIYWTDEDKSAYNGGLFWHTAHYVDAGRATHRSYPNAPGVPGGGPSAEHNYSTGLTLHYLLTGDPSSREAVLRLARWTIDMDDGRKTPLRWLAATPTGTGSATGSFDYHGPGRGPGNGIQTLLNALRLTGDRTFLLHAEALIRRCIHPLDDLDARNLLDAERRWYYTVFLQALGRYLGVKDERGERDPAWHFARSSLLRYARWMALHEYPYLEEPAILEFPTETWAAQDMRKCEVFDIACTYAVDAMERERFAERARFFFAASTSTLAAMPTHVWTRPTVLMTVYGYAHAWFEAHRTELPIVGPEATVEYGRPPVFVPQKRLAIRRAAALAASGALMLLAGAGWYLAG